jgi:hypothetical protein
MLSFSLVFTEMSCYRSKCWSIVWVSSSLPVTQDCHTSGLSNSKNATRCVQLSTPPNTYQLSTSCLP